MSAAFNAIAVGSAIAFGILPARRSNNAAARKESVMTSPQGAERLQAGQCPKCGTSLAASIQINDQKAADAYGLRYTRPVPALHRLSLHALDEGLILSSSAAIIRSTSATDTPKRAAALRTVSGSGF